ncbi:CD1247 N-terminal domain-containing protein [Effusibacillus consociatus]|uniref:CD1247 N-terminal domain-containing protein n=1 Tax=Effusibacillus consociatus TaxID=1117041 RepID=A0ABV9Q512_9BACL
MHQLKERMAYIKGLTSGLDVNRNTPEGRVLLEIIDLMDAVIHSVDRLNIHQEDLEEYVSAIDEDLTDLENDFYGEYDDEDIDVYEVYEDEDGEQDDDIEYLEMECPNCQETVFVDCTVFDDDDVVEVLCPECHETILVNDDSPVTTS